MTNSSVRASTGCVILTRPPSRRRRSSLAFDLLYHAGHDLSARPLHDRRARLEGVVAGRRARLEVIVAGSKLVFPVRRLVPDGLEDGDT